MASQAQDAPVRVFPETRPSWDLFLAERLGALNVGNPPPAPTAVANVAADNAPSPSFHRFAILPFEIRVRIWRFTLPKREPLRVAVLADSGDDDTASDRPSDGMWRPTIFATPELIETTQPYRSLLCTCCESRAEVISFFIPDKLPLKGGLLYLNGDEDIIHISRLSPNPMDLFCDVESAWLEPDLAGLDVSAVQRVGLDTSIFSYFSQPTFAQFTDHKLCQYRLLLRLFLRHFSNLCEIFVMNSDPLTEDEEAMQTLKVVAPRPNRPSWDSWRADDGTRFVWVRETLADKRRPVMLDVCLRLGQLRPYLYGQIWTALDIGYSIEFVNWFREREIRGWRAGRIVEISDERWDWTIYKE